MKTNKMTVVGAWILGAVASVWLGSVMMTEPTAKAAVESQVRQGTTTMDHAKPTVQELPEMVIVGQKPVAKKTVAKPVVHIVREHVLVQGGSPVADSVITID